VTSKRTSDERFEILRQFATKLIDHIFKLDLGMVWYISGFKIGQKMQNFSGILPNVGFVKKKILSRLTKLGNISLGWSKTVVSRVEPRCTAFPPKMLELRNAMSRDRNMLCKLSRCHFKDQN
jgi:hypothetical protein